MRRRDTVAPAALTMIDHVKELRWRLIVVAVVLLVGGIVGYAFYGTILQWIKSPLAGDLYYSSPAGSFSFIIKVATMAGIGFAVPVMIYQLIMFIRPALSKAFSKLHIYSYTALSVFLAMSGVAFGFYVILPGALRFFAGFQVEGLSALIGADSYLTFVTNVLITFMVMFQIPLLLVIIDHINPIQPSKLLKAEKHVVLGGLLVSFFVPFALDITTSLLIAAPIILLYNLSIALIIGRHAWQKWLRARTVQTEQDDFIIDERLISEFFSQNEAKHEEVSLVEMPLFRGFAMEFQESRQASIEELRQSIESNRSQAIAAKVARYNRPAGLQKVIDVR